MFSTCNSTFLAPSKGTPATGPEPKEEMAVVQTAELLHSTPDGRQLSRLGLLVCAQPRFQCFLLPPLLSTLQAVLPVQRRLCGSASACAFTTALATGATRVKSVVSFLTCSCRLSV